MHGLLFECIAHALLPDTCLFSAVVASSHYSLRGIPASSLVNMGMSNSMRANIGVWAFAHCHEPSNMVVPRPSSAGTDVKEVFITIIADFNLV